MLTISGIEIVIHKIGRKVHRHEPIIPQLAVVETSNIPILSVLEGHLLRALFRTDLSRGRTTTES